ncbi:MAG: gliding motility-associated C-terminal domain-containing protein [Lewinellaceae bacterium]|nr:gliding motility-associated C-terminal domain-containing protein [Lewinellaceae bacterium]
MNDQFTVFGERCVRQIRYLRIFSRWGELVFERENFAPDQPNLGWDGRFRNKEFPSDVFVYTVQIEFYDGRVETVQGDVTIIR